SPATGTSTSPSSSAATRRSPAETAALAGAGSLPLRHPDQVQRRAGEKDRPAAEEARGPAVAQAEGLLPQLPLPGRVVGVCPPRGSQGGVARGRVVPPRRLHRHQPEVACEEGRALLQPAGYGGSVPRTLRLKGQLVARGVTGLS